MIRLFACCGLNQSELWCLLTQSETQRYEPGGNVQSAYWPGVFEAGATKVNTGTLCVRHTPQMKRFGDCLELSGDLVRPE